MFKAARKVIGYMLVSLISGFTIFYFWGSSPQWEEAQYAQVHQYELSNAITSNDSTFRVITYNIGYLSGMTNNEALERPLEMFEANKILAYNAIKEANAHLIALQEVDYDAHRSFYANQMEEVATSCQFPYSAQAVNWDKKYVPFPYLPFSMHFGKLVSGQAILSAYPIQKHERIVLERPANNPFYYDAFYIDRLLQIVELDCGGKKLTVMNVHLEAYDSATRQAQSEYVLQEYRKYAAKGAVVLLGDFNSIPPLKSGNRTTVAVFLEEEGLSSAVPEPFFNHTNAMTYPADVPKEQIDYIFYTTKDFESISWRVLGDALTASDHLPLLWEGKWRGY